MARVAHLYNESPFDYETPQNPRYCKLRDLYQTYGPNHIFIVRAVFFNNKSQYGEQGLVAIDGYIVNFPEHWLDKLHEMPQHQPTVDAINESRLGFRIRKFIAKSGGECFTVRWLDLNEDYAI